MMLRLDTSPAINIRADRSMKLKTNLGIDDIGVVFTRLYAAFLLFVLCLPVAATPLSVDDGQQVYFERYANAMQERPSAGSVSFW
jgi:hypothetical protein